MVRGRRSRCKANELIEPRGAAKREVLNDSDEETDETELVEGFFACYLLCSLSPRHKGHTYIGFTVNPQRRIKQHNGEKRCGAWRTKRGRPWEMVLCIYGFPSNVSALQFEWAWQHPTESLAVRKVASTFKSLSGMANKIKLAFTMLTLSCWESLNLTVNFFSTKYMKHTAGCSKLPDQMRVRICSMDDLPCYAGGQALHCSSFYEEEDDDEGDIDKYLNTSGSQFWEPVRYSSEFSRPGEEYYRSSSPSSGTLLELRELECMRASTSLTPSPCTEDSVKENLETTTTTNQPTPKSSENDTTAISTEEKAINLCTPSSGGIIRSKTKRALFDSDIIDLTDSPMVIHL